MTASPKTSRFASSCDSIGSWRWAAGMVRQAGFFDLEERLVLLSAKGDGLERMFKALMVQTHDVMRVESARVTCHL